ncbi:hypothetical protein SEPCBS119000_001839 [Sporothrix epigloea]|uniref:Uncharacterized protein n=1 Tax=Sporothrix epigloea TaxID=1892477 RepID=A0ABP0DCW8_9PEZI
MASNFHIQKPYVLASLPRSLAQADGKSVVGEVFGQRPGVKKRRRAELAVGIDGESANIYDISASRLITSYPVPPQAKFCCAPCSIRVRSSASKDATVIRYTYIATREPSRKLSLFKDTVEVAGATACESLTASLGRTSDIVSLHTLSLPEEKLDTQSAPPSVDLLAVDRDGQVACFDGETLMEKFKVSLTGLSPDLVPRGSAVRVQLAQMGQAADVIKGLALGDYLSGTFPQKIDAQGGFNPDMLYVVSDVTARQAVSARYLHILAVDPSRQTLVLVHYIRLPSTASADIPVKDHPIYHLDVPSGSLFALEGENVLSYDLTRSVPRVASNIAIPGITSFLRLSKSSILASTSTTFSVYNPLFKSLQASTTFDIQTSAKAASNESSKANTKFCTFVSYFPQLELAVALLDSDLVAVQLEPPRTRSKKRRADGLLIDSIGRGTVLFDGKTSETSAPLPKRYLPGTVSAAYLAQFHKDSKSADALLETQNVTEFDDFMAEKLGIQTISDWRWQRPLDSTTLGDSMDETQDGEDSATAVATNGVSAGLVNGHADEGNTSARAAPTQLTAHVKYPLTDRRWVTYAIARIFTIEEQTGSRPRLLCNVPSSSILNYLVDAGHLSVANTRSALREHLRDTDEDDQLLGEALPSVLAQVDPSLDLLLRWLYETKLGATELLSATLLLMRSLELVNRPTNPNKSVSSTVSNGLDADEIETGENGENGAEGVLVQLDQLDQQLHLAEYFLQHVENDPRDLALDVAIGKLGSCPAVATVQGLRRIFRTDEIRSLIEVLRKQMVDQGWATRYVDVDGTGDDGAKAAGAVTDGADAAPLNYSIRLIADLLCRCIDAVRPGEWLINDEEVGAIAAAATAANGDSSSLANGQALEPTAAGGDFFALLKWQVSAALEGVQEALYLRGLVGETVRYGMGVEKMAARAANLAKKEAAAVSHATDSVVRPQIIGSSSSAVTVNGLPLGLRAPAGLARHMDVSPTKLSSGNEVVRRTKRELGHLTSKKVGPYTLERIVF